jgi:hypothetical protein
VGHCTEDVELLAHEVLLDKELLIFHWLVSESYDMYLGELPGKL